MKMAFLNLGCPKNSIDLETILADLDDQVEWVEDSRDADVALINTCAFIKSAKQESIDAILEIAEIKKQRPDFKVLVSGCLPQRYREELAEALPEVDAFFLSQDAVQTRKQLRKFLQLSASCRTLRKRLTPAHYAYLRIADGCDNRCSYCAIPLIKGSFQSRPVNDILKEARVLAADGCREINLVAQDITYYGRDMEHGPTLVTLLEKLSAITELRWIRLLYTHPAHYSTELIRAIADLEKVVKYVDLPIQHIADPILRAMRRHTTRLEIERLIDALRTHIPDLAIRTTVMVGFPGETEKDFKTLWQFVESIRFDRLGVFTYSAEDGTKAGRLRDSVTEKKKQRRYAQIMETQTTISEERNTALIGRSLTVLVDEISAETGQSIARTAWDAPEIDNAVIIDRPLQLGEFYQVQVTGADPFDLFAEIH
jgi:ribosomal protein S12 methylthiotransferase